MLVRIKNNMYTTTVWRGSDPVKYQGRDVCFGMKTRCSYACHVECDGRGNAFHEGSCERCHVDECTLVHPIIQGFWIAKNCAQKFCNALATSVVLLSSTCTCAQLMCVASLSFSLPLMFYDYPFSSLPFRWHCDAPEHLDDSERVFVHVCEPSSVYDEQIFYVFMAME